VKMLKLTTQPRRDLPAVLVAFDDIEHISHRAGHEHHVEVWLGKRMPGMGRLHPRVGFLETTGFEAANGSFSDEDLEKIIKRATVDIDKGVS